MDRESECSVSRTKALLSSYAHTLRTPSVCLFVLSFFLSFFLFSLFSLPPSADVKRVSEPTSSASSSAVASVSALVLGVMATLFVCAL